MVSEEYNMIVLFFRFYVRIFVDLVKRGVLNRCQGDTALQKLPLLGKVSKHSA